MDCTLKKALKKEHDNIKNPILGEESKICPLTGKQICYWCCLHIYRVAQPLTRATAQDFNPGYATIPKIVDRVDLDDVWSTCSQCGRGASD